MSTLTILNSIQRILHVEGSYVLAGLAFVSCLLNLLVFTKESLRKNPCSQYFIAINILNFLYLNFLFIQRILSSGYGIDPMIQSLIYCRCFFYLTFSNASTAPYYIILSSVDRIFMTSRNTSIRKLSTRRIAIIFIVANTFFWLLIHLHACFYIELLRVGPNYYICYYRPGIYTTFISIFSLTINGILPLSLMTICGCWAVHNVRQLGRGLKQPAIANGENATVGRAPNIQSKDQQLIRMVLLEIISYIICKCPSTIFLLYTQATQYNTKQLEQVLIERSILLLLADLYFIDDCINAYLNILISKTYRTEVKNLLCKPFRRGQ